MINLIIVLILIGALLYVMTLLPIDGTIKAIIQVVCIVAVIIWLLRTYGGVLNL